jgi:hypothetical protein
MQNESTKEVKLAVWREVRASPESLCTQLLADEGDWLKFVTGNIKTLRFRTTRGRAVWEEFHFDEDQFPTPVGAFDLYVRFWVSVRTQKSTSKELFPAESERRPFSKVTVSKAENEGELA